MPALNSMESVSLIRHCLNSSNEVLAQGLFISSDTVRSWSKRTGGIRHETREKLQGYLNNRIARASSSDAVAFVGGFCDWVDNNRHEDYGSLMKELTENLSKAETDGREFDLVGKSGNSLRDTLKEILSNDLGKKIQVGFAYTCSTFYEFGGIKRDGSESDDESPIDDILDGNLQSSSSSTFGNDNIMTDKHGRCAPRSAFFDIPRFRRALPQNILQRTKEKNEIVQWWNEMSCSGFPVLVVCGRPGSGRNTLVDQALTEIIKESCGVVDAFELVFKGSLSSTLAGCVDGHKGMKNGDKFRFAVDELRCLCDSREKKIILVLKDVYGDSEAIRKVVQGSDMDALIRAGLCIIVTTPSRFYIERCWQIRLSDPSDEDLTDYLVEAVERESEGFESVSREVAARAVVALDRNLGGITACAKFIADNGHADKLVSSIENVLDRRRCDEIGDRFIDVIDGMLQLKKLGDKTCATIEVFGALPVSGVDRGLLLRSGVDVSEVRNLVRLGILEPKPAPCGGDGLRMLSVADRLVYLVARKKAIHSLLAGDAWLKKVVSLLYASGQTVSEKPM